MIGLFLDCGAPTIYNLLSRRFQDFTYVMGSSLEDRRFDNFDYVKKPEFLEYESAYYSFVLDNMEKLGIYAVLDIINNAELTYVMQKRAEQAGFNPMPIFHFGNDTKWLKRYIDEGYSHIGIGGLVPNTAAILKPALDRLFEDIICDSNGHPKIKAHGLAIAGSYIATRYPWFSVDSTSWVRLSRFGIVIVPKPDRNGNYDFTQPTTNMTVTSRGDFSTTTRRLFKEQSRAYQKYVIDYVNYCGFEFGESKFVEVDDDYNLKPYESWYIKEKNLIEVPTVLGVSNYFLYRDIINAMYYTEMAKSVPPWPWPFKRSNRSIKKFKVGGEL